jgi:hypothetical protein
MMCTKTQEGSRRRWFQCSRCSEPPAPAVCYTILISGRKLDPQHNSVLPNTTATTRQRQQSVAQNEPSRTAHTVSPGSILSNAMRRRVDVPDDNMHEHSPTWYLAVQCHSGTGSAGTSGPRWPTCHPPSHSFTFSFRLHSSISLPPLKTEKDVNNHFTLIE